MVAFWRQSQDSLVVSLALNATSTKVSVNSFGVVSKRCHHLHIMHTFKEGSGMPQQLMHPAYRP